MSAFVYGRRTLSARARATAPSGPITPIPRSAAGADRLPAQPLATTTRTNASDEPFKSNIVLRTHPSHVGSTSDGRARRHLKPGSRIPRKPRVSRIVLGRSTTFNVDPGFFAQSVVFAKSATQALLPYGSSAQKPRNQQPAARAAILPEGALFIAADWSGRTHAATVFSASLDGPPSRLSSNPSRPTRMQARPSS